MSRPLWSFRSPLSGCDAVEPLLPLYADGMATPSETRLVDAHLPDCTGCRAELSWIQATHAALASRPVAVPPPDLHSRIAQAIALSSAASSLRPARAFSLRPAYAAAASLTALGIAFGLSYSLWHAPGQTEVKSITPPKVAKTVPTPVVTRVLPKKIKHTLVASHSVTPAAESLPVAHKTAPETAPMPPPEHVADTEVTPKLLIVPFTPKVPVPRVTPNKQFALGTPVEKHTVVPKKNMVAPKLPDASLVANNSKAPVRIPDEIPPPTVPALPPPLKTASNSGLLDGVKAHAVQMQTVSYSPNHFTARSPYSGAANIVHTTDDSDPVAYIDGVHGP